MPSPVRFDTTTEQTKYNKIYTTVPTQCKPQAESTTYTPITLPVPPTDCRHCNIGCAMEFNYQNPFGWTISAACVNLQSSISESIGVNPCTGMDELNGINSNAYNLLRFYVDNSISERPRRDVVYNDIPYQLEFMEVYQGSLHKLSNQTSVPTSASGTSVSPTYPVEVVLYHSTGATPTPATKNPIPTQWLAVSVFAITKTSFSLSQGFFYDLMASLDTVISEPTTNTSATPGCIDPFLPDGPFQQYMSEINWHLPVTRGGRTPAASEGQATAPTATSPARSSPAILINPRSYWSPYQLLPAKKSFYTYMGEFPYAPCFYTQTSDGTSEATPTPVTWVVMDNPSTMNMSDYNILTQIVARVAPLNDSSLYPTLTDPVSPGDIDTLSIGYNNGTLVSGNSDSDKFYVKCMKKSPAKTGLVSDVVQNNLQQALDHSAELAQIPGGETAPPPNTISTYYSPPSSPMSTLVFSFVFALLFFSMFAASSWINTHPTNENSLSGATNELPHVQSWLIALLCIALFVMYGMSFFHGALGVGIMPLVTLLTVALLFGTLKIALYFDRGGDGSFSPSRIVGGVIMVVLFVLFMAAIFVPVSKTNADIKQTYQFYYTDGSSPDMDIYIGKRANVTINFAGFTMNYNNNYTVGQNTDMAASNPGRWASLGGAQTTPDVTTIPTDSFLLMPANVLNPRPPTTPSSSTNSAVTLPSSLFPSPSYPVLTLPPPSADTTLPHYTPDTITTNTVSKDTRNTFNKTLVSNQKAMLTILNTYNNNMRSSSSDPLTCFVDAYIDYARQSSSDWFGHYWQKTTTQLNSTNVTSVMMTSCPTLFAYLKGWQMSDFSDNALGLAGVTPSPPS